MKKQRSKHIRLSLIMLALTFGLHTVIELLLSINSILWTDTLYRDTIFPDIFTAAQSVLEVAVMSIGLSIIAVSFFMGHKKTSYILVYIGSVVYRRLLAVAVTLIINGDITVDDIFMSCRNLILDMVVLGMAVIIIYSFSKSYRRRSAMLDDASALLFGNKIEKPDISALYPFKKIYGKDNPLQGCLAILGILLSAVKILSRTLTLLIAIPDNILMLVGGYMGDLLVIIIFYATACLLLSWLYSQNEKRRAMNILFGDN